MNACKSSEPNGFIQIKSVLTNAKPKPKPKPLCVYHEIPMTGFLDTKGDVYISSKL